jgi:hypothetical protein
VEALSAVESPGSYVARDGLVLRPPKSLDSTTLHLCLWNCASNRVHVEASLVAGEPLRRNVIKRKVGGTSWDQERGNCGHLLIVFRTI